MKTQENRRFHRLVGAWTASAQRPGKPHSYTKNWPPEKLVGNALTEDAVVWSWPSIIVLSFFASLACSCASSCATVC